MVKGTVEMQGGSFCHVSSSIINGGTIRTGPLNETLQEIDSTNILVENCEVSGQAQINIDTGSHGVNRKKHYL